MVDAIESWNRVASQARDLARKDEALRKIEKLMDDRRGCDYCEPEITIARDAARAAIQGGAGP